MSVPMITVTISGMGTAPQRSDRANYAANGDPFMIKIEGMPDEYNALTDQQNAVATAINQAVVDVLSARDVALAAANFKGEYDDLTRTLLMPASAYHIGAYWMLVSDLTDVTAREPGVDSEWVAIGAVWERRTAAFTAVPGIKYLVDAGVPITLPASPTDTAQIWFAALGNMIASPATIARNGKTIGTKAEDMTWRVNIGFSLIYDSTTGDWRVG